MLFNAIACSVVSGLTSSSDRLTPISVGLSSVINNQQIVVGIKVDNIQIQTTEQVIINVNLVTHSTQINTNIPTVNLFSGLVLSPSNIIAQSSLPTQTIVYHDKISVSSFSATTHVSCQIKQDILITVSNLLSATKFQNVKLDVILHNYNPAVNTTSNVKLDINLSPGNIQNQTHTQQIQITTSVLLHLVKNLISDIIISQPNITKIGIISKNIIITPQIKTQALLSWEHLEPASQWSMEEISNGWVIKY